MTPHPTNYSKSLRQLEDATETLTRITNLLPLRWAALVDALAGQPGAQAYDGDPGGPGSVVVCDHHDRDIAECHRADLHCTGHPIPARTDPTANAGVRGDPAGRDIAEVRRLATTILRSTETIAAILSRYETRPANDYERSLTTIEMLGNDDPGCFSCARTEQAKGIPRWVPVHSGVKIDGEVYRLCSWCRRWAGIHNALPPRDAVKRHHGDESGKRSA